MPRKSKPLSAVVSGEEEMWEQRKRVAERKLSLKRDFVDDSLLSGRQAPPAATSPECRIGSDSALLLWFLGAALVLVYVWLVF